MRTIKFRAFDKKEKIISEVVTIDYDQEAISARYDDDFYWIDFKDIELLQYTGIKDIHGTDIYEGDVVSGATKNKISGGIYFHKKEIVSFKDGCFVTLCKDGGYHILSELSGIEVIGNIYEDKEAQDD